MSNSITSDQLDVLTLPLGKAESILELFVMDLPCHQANGVTVVLALLKEANEIAHSFADEPKDTVPDLGSTGDTKLVLQEALSEMRGTQALLNTHLAELKHPGISDAELAELNGQGEAA